MAEVKFEITLEEKQALEAIKKIANGVEDFGKKADKNFKGASQAFNVFKGVLGAEAVIAGFKALGNAASDLFNTIAVDGVNSAIAEEQALTRLETSIRLAGKSTAGAKKDFLAFANALEDTTGVQEDVIINNVALLQSLTNLSNKGLKDATAAAIDMSKALGVDLETATRALGAAANGNLSLLQRLTKKTFEEGATDAETFQNAITKLNASFGGAAAANFKTYEGAVTGVKNSFEDFIKELGKTITENEAVRKLLFEVSEAFKKLEKFVKDNKKAIDDFVSSMATGLIKVVKEGVIVLMDFLSFLLKNKETIKDLAIALGVAVVAYGTYTVAAGIAATATAALGTSATIASGALAIVGGKATLIVTAIAALSFGVLKLVQNFDLVSGSIKKFIGETIVSLANAITGTNEKAGFLGKALAAIFPESLRTSMRKYGEELIATGQKQIDLANKSKQADQDRSNSAKKAEADIIGTYQRTGDAFGLFQMRQLEAFDQAFVTKQEKLLEQQGMELAARQGFDQELLDQYKFFLGEQELAQQLSNIRKLEEDGKTKEALRARASLHNKVIEEEEKRSATNRMAWSKKTGKEQVEFLGGIFGDISSLQSESSQELFAIGKAGAIAQAIVSGYLGIARALEVPPPFGQILAGIVAVASAANLAKLAAAQPPKRQGGGLLPGVVSPTDTAVFQGAPGELVLNRRQQTDLFNAINQNQIGSSGNVSVVIQGNVIADDDSQVQRLIERINDNIQYRNASLA